MEFTNVNRISFGRAEASRLAVLAQLHPTQSAPSAAQAVEDLGAVQLDGLQTVALAHRLTILARLGDNATVADVDAQLWPTDPAVPARVFDVPAHAACIAGVADWPVWAFRRNAERARRRGTFDPDHIKAVLRFVDNDGPCTLRDIESGERERDGGTDRGEATQGWNWSPTKRLVEHLVRSGELVVTRRRGRVRIFDLPERQIAETRTAMPPDEASCFLVSKALSRYAVATTADVRGYFGLTARQVQAGLQRLPNLVEVSIDGWPSDTYATSDVLDRLRGLRPSADPKLLGPFDNLLWDRDRIRRVFDYDYTLEAYKPHHLRQFGPYVMSLLLEDRFIGRLDVRRDGEKLRTNGIFAEAAPAASKGTGGLAQDASSDSGGIVAEDLDGDLRKLATSALAGLEQQLRKEA